MHMLVTSLRAYVDVVHNGTRVIEEEDAQRLRNAQRRYRLTEFMQETWLMSCESSSVSLASLSSSSSSSSLSSSYNKVVCSVLFCSDMICAFPVCE